MVLGYTDETGKPRPGSILPWSVKTDCRVRRHGHAGHVTARLGEAESRRAIQSADSGSVNSLDIPTGSTQWPACGAEGAGRHPAVAVEAGKSAESTLYPRTARTIGTKRFQQITPT